MNAKNIMARFYQNAHGDPTKLPWYQKQPEAFVSEFLPDTKGKALDVGCGSGEHSVWLAKHGFEVTGIDIFAEALTMASHIARQNQLNIRFLNCDLFAFDPGDQFDLVYDSGCLHSLVGGERKQYKKQLLEWLKPNAAFILMHWGKRHLFDWRPIGPKRRSKENIVQFFEPEFYVDKYHYHDFKADFPFGPVVRGMCFRFKKK
jgi:SAM-dependent methyltransferase